jgi:hypothetical protein
MEGKTLVNYNGKSLEAEYNIIIFRVWSSFEITQNFFNFEYLNTQLI